MAEHNPHYDLLIVGGGINGAGIARDAATRGLKVLLVEQSDLASATSSRSSKLIHGGLRYLEQYEFKLVAEALAEREVLLRIAPHLVEPLRFVMPHVPGLRPRWMIRLGLFLYDHLGRRTRLQASSGVDLRAPPYSGNLKPSFSAGFVYADCRVDDARLVLANLMSAHELGATIATHTQFVSAKRCQDHWEVFLSATSATASPIYVQGIVNAAGPWVQDVLDQRLRQPSRDNVKLVQGSHIVVAKAYSGGHAFILQNDDGRVVFMIPFEDEYTLIGTTDVDFGDAPATPTVSVQEVEYLCRAASRYLARPVSRQNIVWSYSGIRPLFDDGSADPSKVTRDYTLRLDSDHGSPPVLSIYGGKLTTYRKLAQHAVDHLAPWFPRLTPSLTATAVLPGGDLGGMSPAEFSACNLRRDFAWLPEHASRGLARRHGTYAYRVLGGAKSASDLGPHFGADLYGREIDYMIDHEWATCAEDVLYRRSKAGLHLTAAQKEAVSRYVTQRR